jgi:hypothetical protein
MGTTNVVTTDTHQHTAAYYQNRLGATVEARASAHRMAVALEGLADPDEIIAIETAGMWQLYEEFSADVRDTVSRAAAEGIELDSI